MVAALTRLGSASEGKMVVVREPIGFVSELVGSPRPVFAWLVQSLGEPIDIRGKPSRAFYVPDCCLTPVSELPQGIIEKIVKDQNDDDLESALADARMALGAQDLAEAEFDRLLEKAATQALLQKAIETVPIQLALKEIGFKPGLDGLDGLVWAGVHDGVELVISAFPDWIVNWRIMGNAKTRRTLVCEERVLPNELPRGKVFLTVLQFWRTTFGKDMVPDCLQLGAMYEEHLDEMRVLNPGLPSLWVDPRVFRMTLKWLREKQDGLWSDQDTLELSYADSLLRLAMQGIAYGCPARGHWTDACRIRVLDFVNLAQMVARAKSIQLQQTAHCIFVNGCKVPFVDPGDR
jgi:hypothetical protein